MTDLQRCEFRVSKMGTGYFLDVNRLAMSPRAAACHNPDAFLAFAKKVAREAEKIRAERSQLRMAL